MARKYGLNTELLLRVSKPIKESWKHIAADSMEFCNTNDDAIEAAIDCGRLDILADDSEAQDIVNQVCIDHGYSETVQFLSDNMEIY